MDITSLVRSIVGAFDDAATLVKRIRDRQDKKDDPEAVQDLLTSLSLGPVVVRGYYDSDIKRFGESYALGDHVAREQMKDILIHLQMTLLTTLRMVLLDDKELDYNIIQGASDDCRVNAGVCLGQLSQRLSENARMYSQTPPAYASGGIHMTAPIGLHYSSSQSTHSSSGTRRMPFTPELMSDQFARLGLGSGYQFLDRQVSTSSSGSQHGFSRRGTDASVTDAYYPNMMPPYTQRMRGDEEPMMRRPSSHTLAPEDSVLLSPTRYTTNDSQASPPHFIDRNSFGSDTSNPYATNLGPSRNDSYQSQPTRFVHDDYTNTVPGNPLTYDALGRALPDNRQSTTSYANRAFESNHSTLEHVSSLEAARQYNISRQEPDRSPPRSDVSYAAQFRKPVPLPYPSDQPSANQTEMPENKQHRPSMSAPIPVDTETTPPPMPSRMAVRPPDNRHMTSPIERSRSGSHRPTNTNGVLSRPPPLITGPLNLPTEKNLLGFCKGAFRLFAGMEKKAFSAANRPVGYASMIPYWRCEKCLFEGPMSTFINPNAGKKAKPEKTFDPTIRIDSGIRYKWAFLAKCHVHLKSPPEGKRDGSFGSFACIFCCAEGAMRNWINGAGDASSINGSTRGSIASTGAAGSTPIFGNLQSFLDHLQMHRSEEGWPNAEMQGRMKCVVGRIADKSEDFEINLMPLGGNDG